MKEFVLLSLLAVILVGVWVNVFVCIKPPQEARVNVDKGSTSNSINVPSSEFSSTTSGHRIGHTSLLLTALAITLQVTSTIANHLLWHKTHQIVQQTSK